MADAICRVLRLPYPCRPTANNLTQEARSYGGAATASLRPTDLIHIHARSERRPIARMTLTPRRAMRRIIFQSARVSGEFGTTATGRLSEGVWARSIQACSVAANPEAFAPCIISRWTSGIQWTSTADAV